MKSQKIMLIAASLTGLATALATASIQAQYPFVYQESYWSKERTINYVESVWRIMSDIATIQKASNPIAVLRRSAGSLRSLPTAGVHTKAVELTHRTANWLSQAADIGEPKQQLAGTFVEGLFLFGSMANSEDPGDQLGALVLGTLGTAAIVNEAFVLEDEENALKSGAIKLGKDWETFLQYLQAIGK